MACTAERTFAILGLPQINPVNEEIKQRMEVMFGSNNGYDYTYLYPGIQKVAQAAGRVIRTLEDQGVIVLMDDRFAQAEVLALLPAWWPAAQISDCTSGKTPGRPCP